MSAAPLADINESTYQWCVKAFSRVHERLGINIKVHDADGHLDDGEIFLFNHFARFETVIPQYIIHQATGAFCRCIAAAELFAASEKFAKFLWGVGAVPTDHPGLLPFLAAEILRGRKVIVFPEGGMIKDRQVIDGQGQFSIFSSSGRTRRKHHQGAAATALALAIFKQRILSVFDQGDTPRLERWVDALGLVDIDALAAAARRPTLIVPGNITFYPIRTEDNILRKGAELLGVNVAENVKDELLIEGNLLFKRTDMDIRFGAPVAPEIDWGWRERRTLKKVFEEVDSLEELFALKSDNCDGIECMVAETMGRETGRLRDQCMHAIYERVTVNVSHLASRLIFELLDTGVTEIAHDRFHMTLYRAIKNVQQEPSVHLHRSVTNPEAYDGIHRGVGGGFEQFLEMATSSELVEAGPDRYRFLPKLLEEHAFHEVRLENMVSVYANEVAPIAAVRRAVEQAIRSDSLANDIVRAKLLFDDELRALECCKMFYSKPRHAAINDQETATENPSPYLMVPEERQGIGVVLVHGFLASPAELRPFGERLAALGYPVVGVRLPGHGTSPWDLRDRSREDWLASIRRGVEIMSGFADKVCLVGFSTGGALSLRLAADSPQNLAGVVAISPPYKFRNKNLIFVPVIHGINKLTRWISSWEGVMPFRVNESEHPHINYRNIPIRGLFELRRLVDELAPRLRDVECPVKIIQGAEDQIVDPKSANLIIGKIGSKEKSFHMIPSERHGILNEDIGGTQDLVIEFIQSLAPAPSAAVPPATRAERYRVYLKLEEQERAKHGRAQNGAQG